MAIYSIYMLISPTNKAYIGLTRRTVEKRFKEHVGAWKYSRKKHCKVNSFCNKLLNAFDKYDPSLWVVETLFITDDAKLASKTEQDLIKQHDTIKKGYNISKGGVFSYPPTKPNKAKGRRNPQQSQRMLGSNNPRYGGGYSRPDVPDRQRGINNSSFKGYWHTPKGVFATSKEAAIANNLAPSSIRSYCNDNLKPFHKSHHIMEWRGLTPKEVGFFLEKVL